SALLFFFSRRRRHTRFSRDWSSDVCSSDLVAALYPSLWLGMFIGTAAICYTVYLLYAGIPTFMGIPEDEGFMFSSSVLAVGLVRSEERRVGEGGRAGGAENCQCKVRGDTGE